MLHTVGHPVDGDNMLLRNSGVYTSTNTALNTRRLESSSEDTLEKIHNENFHNLFQAPSITSGIK
jgi:hypothetical protein